MSDDKIAELINTTLRRKPKDSTQWSVRQLAQECQVSKLDIATGEVISRCSKRHRHQEFLNSLNRIETQVPKGLDVHLVMDNYCTHRQKKVQAWLAKRPRYHVHFTPTYSSWLNQVERWFGLITQRAIRRGSFTSTKQLRQKIDAFVRNYNKHSKPFKWTATADSILNKLGRLCNAISGTEH